MGTGKDMINIALGLLILNTLLLLFIVVEIIRIRLVNEELKIETKRLSERLIEMSQGFIRRSN